MIIDTTVIQIDIYALRMQLPVYNNILRQDAVKETSHGEFQEIIAKGWEITTPDIDRQRSNILRDWK